MGKKFIKVEGQLIEVSEEIYKEYYKQNRRERYLEERDLVNGTFSFNQYDTDKMLGEDLLVDMLAASFEEAIENKELYKELKKAILSLQEEEKELVQALYFEDKSLRQIAKEWDMPLTTLHRLHNRILGKLKEILKNFE